MYPRLSYRPDRLNVENLSGGIVIDANECKVFNNQSPDMLNMYFDGNILKKREGQQMLFYEENIIACSKDVFYSYIIYHAGNKIKAYNYDTKKISTLMRRVPVKKGCFFLYNGYIYYIGTGEFYKISRTDGGLKCDVVSGYIPNVLVNCDETSRGDSNEQYNYLTSGISLTYNTASNIKSIAFPDIDADSNREIIVEYDGRKISGYTVDWDNKIINFETYLPAGHNLVKITLFEKTDGLDRRKITDCTLAESFGGLSAGISDGTRMFLSGNEAYATTFFYSALKNPEYFPVNQFDILGDDNDPVTCLGKQYNGLVFFKKRSIYISYYIYENGEVNFSVSRLNSNIGCDCNDTLETIDNQLVWLNSIWGVMTLSSTNIKDEKNVKCISGNINGCTSDRALLLQDDLNSSVGFVNRGKYYLVTKKYTYVLNISDDFYISMKPKNMRWFLMDNISAVGYVFLNREAYVVNKHGISFFSNVLYDFDKEKPINAYITTKAFDFGAPEIFKNIFDVSFALKTGKNSYFKFEATDENGPVGTSIEKAEKRFEFLRFSFPAFTFSGKLFSYVFKKRFARRRTKYLRLKFSNNCPESQMSISDISINYSVERSIKYNGI